MSIQQNPMPVTPRAYPRERVFPGALKRLRTEDWDEMARPAYGSPNHVSNLERWIKRAKAENPSLDDAQAAALGQMLKDEHYRKCGEAGARALRLRAEINAIEGTDGE